MQGRRRADRIAKDGRCGVKYRDFVPFKTCREPMQTFQMEVVEIQGSSRKERSEDIHHGCIGSEGRDRAYAVSGSKGESCAVGPDMVQHVPMILNYAFRLSS